MKKHYLLMTVTALVCSLSVSAQNFGEVAPTTNNTSQTPTQDETGATQQEPSSTQAPEQQSTRPPGAGEGSTIEGQHSLIGAEAVKGVQYHRQNQAPTEASSQTDSGNATDLSGGSYP